MPVVGAYHTYVKTSLLLLQDALGSYCAHLLADYIVLAAAPADAKGASTYGLQAGDGAGSSLTAEAWTRLRKGAYALYGACGPTQVRPWVHPMQKAWQQRCKRTRTEWLLPQMSKQPLNLVCQHFLLCEYCSVGAWCLAEL